MPRMGDERFVCEVTPAASVEAAARAAGWLPDEHGSPGDHVSIEVYAERLAFTTFDEAVAYGKKFVAAVLDYWGQAIVDRMVYEPDEDVPEWTHWQRRQSWAVDHEEITEL